jgi:hypothetical protein
LVEQEELEQVEKLIYLAGWDYFLRDIENWLIENSNWNMLVLNLTLKRQLNL